MIVVRYADDLVVGFEREGDAHRFLDAMREARGICAVTPPGQDPPIEFGRFAAVDRKRVRPVSPWPIARYPRESGLFRTRCSPACSP